MTQNQTHEFDTNTHSHSLKPDKKLQNSNCNKFRIRFNKFNNITI